MSGRDAQTPYLRRLPRMVFVVLADYYGLLASALIVLWLVVGERFHPVNIFVSLAPMSLLPGLALPLALLLRAWRGALLLVLPLLAFLGLYASAFVPPTSAPETGVPQLTVMTYNIHANNSDYAGMEALLRTYQPDIVALQEVTPWVWRYMQEHLTDLYPYQIMPDDQPYFTQMILSRWEVQDSAVTGPANRPTLRAEVLWDERALLVYNVHLPLPLGGVASRNEATGILLDEAAAEGDTPLILLGDFNMSDASGDYRRIRARYTDSFRSAGYGLGSTFPNWGGRGLSLGWIPPSIRVDYVFTNAALVPVQSDVLYTGASDHLPVIATLQLHEP